MADLSDDRPDVSVQDLSKFVADSSIRGRSGLVLLLWWFVRGTLFGCSPQFMYGWRRWLLRRFGCEVGTAAAIRSSVRIQYPWKVKIGAYAQIGDEVELSSTGPITIGDCAVLSQRAFICAGSHDISHDGFDTLPIPIVIEREAWICACAFVHPGVRVGRGAIIAACAVLRSDAAPYQIYAGSPAVRIGDRRDRLKPSAISGLPVAR